MKTVTVIIPCRNEIQYLRNCVESLLNNDYPQHLIEYLIIDGMSTDGSYELACELALKYGNVGVIQNRHKIKPPGLNQGIKATESDLVCVADAHAEYSPDYIRTCVKKLIDPTIDAVGCERAFTNIHVIKNKNISTPHAFNIGIREGTGELILIVGCHAWYPNDYIRANVNWSESGMADVVGGWIRTVERNKNCWAQAMAVARADRFGVGNSEFRQEQNQPKYVESVFGGCYRREVFDKVGLFNEKLTGSQDLELNLRIADAGMKILLVPEIKCIYYARTNYGAFLKHAFKDGKWAVLPWLYARRFLGWRRLFPMAFILSSPISIMAYLPLAWLRSMQISYKRHNYKYLFTMPVMFLSFHFAYGMGNLWGTIKTITEILKKWLYIKYVKNA